MIIEYKSYCLSKIHLFGTVMHALVIIQATDTWAVMALNPAIIPGLPPTGLVILQGTTLLHLSIQPLFRY